MEKYKLQKFDIFTCFSLGSHAIIILHLESWENSLDRIGEEMELYINIKKRDLLIHLIVFIF